MNARITLVGAALLLLLGGACSGPNDDDQVAEASPTSAAPSTSTPANGAEVPFRHRAAAACTQAVNSTLTSTELPGLELLAAIRADEEPAADQLQAWTTQYDDRLAKLRGMRQVLSSVRSQESDEQAAWQRVVDAGKPEMEEIQATRDLLATGDWQRISDEFLEVSSPATEAESLEPALATLELGQTDCAHPYSMVPVAEGSEGFVAEVAQTCLTVALRRDDADAASDQTVVLDALADSLQEAELTAEQLTELKEAVGRLATEWEQTAQDVEAVAATPVDPEAWAEVLAAVRERVEVFTDRVEATRSGDPSRIVESLQPDWQYPAVDFRAAGVDRGICSGVSG